MTPASDAQRFGRYELLEQLGRGGMGVVWKAWDPQLQRVVALKQILGEDLNPALVERFMSEARAAAKLRHPNIVPIHDVGVEAGKHFFTMDFIEGRSLDEERPAPRDALRIVRDAARALQHAHEHGIIHRDIKPANILVDAKGAPYVTDFGLAKDVRHASGLTVSGTLMGTPQYMSPEQALGNTADVGPASDQFSLGVTLYELLTGRLPFRGESLHQTLNAIIEEDTPRMPEVNRDVETICLKALEKHPANRYAGLREFADDLTRTLDGEPIRARPISAAARLWRKASKHRFVVIPTAAAFALALGFGAWAVSSQRRASEKNETEARALLDAARPELQKAVDALYDSKTDYALLVNRVEVGQKLIEAAIAKAPRLAEGHYLLGRAWEIRGWDDRAEACWRRAVELDPNLGPAHDGLGRLLMAKEFYAHLSNSERAETENFALEATKEFEAAARCGMADPVRRDIGAAMLAFARGDGKAARRLAEQGIAAHGDADGVEEFHWIAGLAQELEDSGPAFDRAIRKRPKYPQALFCRGAYRANRGDLDGALADYDDALKIRQRFPEAFTNRGAVRHSRAEKFCRDGRREDAVAEYDAEITDYTEALRIEPRMRIALISRAEARRSRADTLPADRVQEIFAEFDRAIGDCTDAIAIDARNPSAHSARALVHRDKGAILAAMKKAGGAATEAAAAESDFSKALEVAPADWNQRTAVQAELDRLRKSREDY